MTERDRQQSAEFLDTSRWSKPQQEAIMASGKNVLVSAGAGSGKTSVLVERVARCLVQDGLDVTQLLIVTFTEAAAAEMRIRIARRLEALVREANERGDLRLSQHLEKQLGLLELAQISTLHSFCMAVVRRNFLSLGLEPRFNLLSEDASVMLRTEQLHRLLEALSETPSPEFRKMVEQFGNGDPMALESLILRLDLFARSQPDPAMWLRAMAEPYEQAQALVSTGNLVTDADVAALPWAEPFGQWLSRALREAQAHVQEALLLSGQAEELLSYSDHFVKWLEIIEPTCLFLEQGLHLEEAADSLRAMDSLPRVRAKDHPLKKAVTERREKAKKLCSRVRLVLDRGVAHLVQDIANLAPAMSLLMDVTRGFQEACLQAKLTKGVLDFQDLEHMAMSALKDGLTGEADRLKEQYAEIFVDEYQDTSPIQDALIQAIVRPIGNLFIVGDVKQSIYRFRMAEPDLFLEKYHRYRSGEAGRVIDLASNYRSRTAVVETVNYLFKRLFTPQFGGIAYDDNARMQAGAIYPDADVDQNSFCDPVEIHWVSRTPSEEAMGASELGFDEDEPDRQEDDLGMADDGPPAESSGAPSQGEELAPADLSALEKEFLVIAKRIRTWMGLEPGTHRKHVFDAHEQAYRPLMFRDIVVLMRSVKGRMNTALDVFRRLGIPAYGATSVGFFGAVEVQWLLSALAVVDNPRRDVDLAAMLRSPLCGLTDADLAHIRTAAQGPYVDALRRLARDGLDGVPEATIANVRRVWRQLSRWRRVAKRAGAEKLLRTMIDESDLLTYLLGMPDGDVRRANVLALVDQARAFDARSFDGVYGFVTWIRDAKALALDMGEARTLGEHEDVVRFMTIHQSKGLEFPVVIVADLGKAFRVGGDEKRFALHRHFGCGPVFLDSEGHQRWHTIPSISVAEADVAEALAEEARVLYVALTRAREHLLLVGSAKQLLARIHQAEQVQLRVDEALPTYQLLGAKTAMDWLLPAFHANPLPSTMQVTLWDVPDGELVPVTLDRGPSTSDAAQAPLVGQNWDAVVSLQQRAVLSLRDLERVIQPGILMSGIDEADAFQPEAAATLDEASRRQITKAASDLSIPSKVSATDLRRLWVAKQRAPHPGGSFGSGRVQRATHLLADPPFASPEGEVIGAHRGTAFHKFMQLIDLRRSYDLDGITDVLTEFRETCRIPQDVLDLVNLEDVLGFLHSPLGDMLRGARRIYSEQSFFSRILLDAESDGPFVAVQGVIDCLAELDNGRWLIVDYKTDRIHAQDAPEKAEEYAAQVATYQRVVQDVLASVHQESNDRGQTAAVDAYIYFVHPGVTVPMGSLDLSTLFQGLHMN